MNGLTKFEQTILATLQAREGQVVTKEELERALYPAADVPNPNSNGLEVFIGRIRRKIGKERIQTKRGSGYMLVPQPLPEQQEPMEQAS
jgi:two-component system OmpR family response regulator